MKIKKQGYDWLFKATFTLPGNVATVEGDKIYFIMKTAATVADGSAAVNEYISLTDSSNLSGTTVTGYIPIPKAKTKTVAVGDYVAEAYWEIAGSPTKWYIIGSTLQITVEDAVKDVPA